jgi:hypothetical protein
MINEHVRSIFIGDTNLKINEREIHGEYISLLDEQFYKIQNFDGMSPFFMSLVSSSNHWCFISSTGGLSAGRTSAEQALFPYYTDDKLTENHENTGSKIILLITRDNRTSLWEPLSERHRGSYQIERNIYKNISGTALIFEETNHSLGLSYRYAWRTSDQFGFVKTSWISNLGTSSCHVELVDGLQNILPANVTSGTQNIFSQLLDAYKRSEVDPQTGLAIFALNSTLTDLAEPSESLLATTVMQVGLEEADYFLSSRQLDSFRNGLGVHPETEVRGQRGAYFVHTSFQLDPEAERSWHLVADVSQDHAAIVQLSKRLKHSSILQKDLECDVEAGHANLKKFVASADGLQMTADQLCTAHHFANVMFNVMRGGIFTEQYKIHKQDFIEFIQTRNHAVLNEDKAFFADLPEELDLQELLTRANASASADLIRLSYAYLPLSFSRRHGDPSRPWNRFMIDLKKPDGSLKLGYEGNWRDIFQNWEALAYSYPEYVESMICVFLNATTADGYNPYRITQAGIDWETPEPNNPWANIGYWSDHQIIYLQKLMEISVKVHPGKLQSFLSQPIFSTANVPYRLKAYNDLLKDSFNTIEFNWDLQKEIQSRVHRDGTDGMLVRTYDGQLLYSNLTEKLLTLLLGKLVNFVPEGGIWMNTQRPEWNDANNALVGKGLSVVTLCYVRRFIDFSKGLLEQSQVSNVLIGAELQRLFIGIFSILKEFIDVLQGSFTDEQRRAMMNSLGQAGSDSRWDYYTHGFSGEKIEISKDALIEFLNLAKQYVDHSLRADKRYDDLYHAYNILHLQEDPAKITHLSEMLEGQVSILSSGLLTGEESLRLLKSMRNSRLYRADQHSYILYPDRDLPGFLEKNTLTSNQVSEIKLLDQLAKNKDKTLIVEDENGQYHFSGTIRNWKDVARILESLKTQPEYSELVKTDCEQIHTLFENTFRHDEFTGRSGTFFAYEGLGSIYWHMVSKLLLAVQETILRTRNEASTNELIFIYADIRKGLSFNKTPEVYGAFPTDPYSHTPKGQGAKQPGMTGLVKEEILTRQTELGLTIADGRLEFDALLFNPQEFLDEASEFSYIDVNGWLQTLRLESDSLAYTFCQTPIVIKAEHESSITIYMRGGTVQTMTGHSLDETNSQHIFQRNGVIHHLVVTIPRTSHEH